jgi:phosphinothricin acetyltransferase
MKGSSLDSAELSIRGATAIDLPSIRDIYNHAVTETVMTFDIEPKTPEEMQCWFDEHDARHPVIVGIAGPEVIGWAALSHFSKRPGYRLTVEISTYIHPNHQNRGYGSILFSHMLKQARDLDHHVVLAFCTDGNTAVTRIFVAHKFTKLGVLPEVAFKRERFWGLEIWHLLLDNPGSLPDRHHRIARSAT